MFDAVAEDPSGQDAFLVEVATSDEGQPVLWLARQGNQHPKEENYSLADLTHADPSYPGQFATYDDHFSLAGVQVEGTSVYSRSGTLTIIQSSDSLLEGTFEAVVFLRDDDRTEIRLSGRFSAVTVDLGWPAF